MNEKEQVLDSLIKENTSKEIDTTTKELNQIPKTQDLFDLKLGEELNDAEHSRRNTELLNHSLSVYACSIVLRIARFYNSKISIIYISLVRGIVCS